MNPRKITAPRWTLCICAGALLAVAAHGQSPTPAPVASPASSATPALSSSAVVSATPAPAATPAVSGSPAASPVPVIVIAASPTPSLLKKIGVKIMFLPPPMDGTISLGIYDKNGKLVRVLHKAATSDEFVAALDGFITHWDGLDDAGKPMPPGRYDARGYMVGAVQVRPSKVTTRTVTIPAATPNAATRTPIALPNAALPNIPLSLSMATPAPSPATEPSSTANPPVVQRTGDLQSLSGKPFTPPKKIRVSLIDNPLDRDRAGSAEVTVGLDASGCWLELADGLPLLQISKTPSAPGNGVWAAISRVEPGKPLMVMVGTSPGSVQGFTITNISEMVAFDCGDFDFAGVGKW